MPTILPTSMGSALGGFATPVAAPTVPVAALESLADVSASLAAANLATWSSMSLRNFL